jgi:hypothetical protein
MTNRIPPRSSLQARMLAHQCTKYLSILRQNADFWKRRKTVKQQCAPSVPAQSMQLAT